MDLTGNVFGHALLFVPFSGGTSGGSNDGLYFQVARLYGYPLAMTQADYRRYLKENKKIELDRFTYRLASPYTAYSRMIELMQIKWFWKIFCDNCVTFVEKIARAGGAQIDLWQIPRLN